MIFIEKLMIFMELVFQQILAESFLKFTPKMEFLFFSKPINLQLSEITLSTICLS